MKPQLTDDMRRYLGEADGKRLLWDIIREFMTRFDITDPKDAGRLLAAWVRETI